MFKSFITLAILFTFTHVFAQESKEQLSLDSTPTVVVKGARFSLIRSMLSQSQYVNENGTEIATQSNPHVGFGIGYAYIPVDKIGYSLGFSYLANEAYSSSSIFRFDGNIASAFNSFITGKLGLNWSFLNGRSRLDRSGLGYNAGVGFKFNSVLGAEVNYVSMSATSPFSNENILESTRQQGMEVQLLATF